MIGIHGATSTRRTCEHALSPLSSLAPACSTPNTSPLFFLSLSLSLSLSLRALSLSLSSHCKVNSDTAAAFAAANLIAAHGLGGRPSFPDLDMLPLGFIAAPGDSHHVPTHNTSLTPSEQRTQMTLWSMARSPLFFGGDLNALDDFTYALLTNAEVLRVDG